MGKKMKKEKVYVVEGIDKDNGNKEKSIGIYSTPNRAYQNAMAYCKEYKINEDMNIKEYMDNLKGVCFCLKKYGTVGGIRYGRESSLRARITVIELDVDFNY